ELDTHTRAISSITSTVASSPAPAPPYCSGTCGAWNSDATSASAASCGYRACASTSAAYGAILSSASLRTAARTALCSSDSVNMFPHNWTGVWSNRVAYRFYLIGRCANVFAFAASGRVQLGLEPHHALGE